MKKFLSKLKANRQAMEDYVQRSGGSDKERMEALLAQMRSGKGIATIGAVCPLFWMSILLGQSIGAIIFNFCHSMVYVAIGLFMYFKSSKKGLKVIEGAQKAKGSPAKM